LIARRDILRWGLGLGLISASGAMLKSLLWPAPVEADELRNLESFAAALLPDDGLNAADLSGLAARLAERADADRGLRRIVRRGSRWLDEAAAELRGRAFSALDLADRETLLRRAAGAAPESLPRVLFERLRLELFGLYYARAETAAALGLPAPPQPAGFPDYTRAP
jgi:hypothetical protein